jgi:hypothetical protein
MLLVTTQIWAFIPPAIICPLSKVETRRDALRKYSFFWSLAEYGQGISVKSIYHSISDMHYKELVADFFFRLFKSTNQV